MSHNEAGAQPCAEALLIWYDRNRRRLPWRALPGTRPDPYRVWLSEIMLQQTTVAAVAPYFEAFLARWPTVEALAAAPLDEVLAAWAGLGYYARARNLHACATAVVERYGGRFPNSEAELRALPGIGPYTAAAIAAIAFSKPAAPVDGNIERVIARAFGVANLLPAAKACIARIVADLVPAGRPGDFAQALMDLGATICTPKRPACGLCPWMATCRGRATGNPETFPVRPDKAARPTRRGAVFWAERPDGTILLTRRPGRGLLAGMAAPWATPLSRDVAPGEALLYAPFGAPWRRLPGEVEHVFTHFRLLLTVFAAQAVADAAPGGGHWVRLEELSTAGLPTVMLKAAAHARTGLHGDDAGVTRRRPDRRARSA